MHKQRAGCPKEIDRASWDVLEHPLYGPEIDRTLVTLQKI
jgi:hypothetical protein